MFSRPHYSSVLFVKDRRPFWKATVLGLERKASFEVHIDATGKSYEEGGHSWVLILGASTIEVKTEDSYKSLACPDNIVCSRLV